MAADLANRPYIKYTSDIEQKPPGEDEDIQAVADMINQIQKAQYNSHRHCYSGKRNDAGRRSSQDANTAKVPMLGLKA